MELSVDPASTTTPPLLPSSPPLQSMIPNVPGSIKNEYSIPSSCPPLIQKKLVRKRVPVVAGHTTEGQMYKPHFKFTRFSTATSNVDITRNVTNKFLSRPGQEVLKFRMEDDRKNIGKELPIIVIHPGSRNLRVGLHTDIVPKTIPSVLARRVNRPMDPLDMNPMNIVMSDFNYTIETQNGDTENGNEEVLLDESLSPSVNKKMNAYDEWELESREGMEEAFKSAMKKASLRIPPNAVTLVQNFNSSSEGVEIPTMNDRNSIEWIYPTSETTPLLLVGQQALDLVVSETPEDYHYRLIWPFFMRTWQFSPPTSTFIMAWRQDVSALLRYSIEQCGYKPSETHIALVVPDLFHSTYIETLLTVLFEDLEVNQVLLGQEAVMACYGAGLSTACIVDIGATCSTVALVEQGELIAANVGMYGGDHVTIEFVRGLQRHRFPIPLDLKLPWDWHLAESLKEKWCTSNESELGIQLYDVYYRIPHKLTQIFQVKVYNEVYMAPLALFYPGVFSLKTQLTHFCQRIPHKVGNTDKTPVASIVNVPLTQLLSYALNPTTDSLHTIIPSLDQLVTQLLMDQTSRSEDRLKKFTGSILMVGGASRSGLKFLENKLKLLFPSVLVTPPPRDMNPAHVVWKGLAVATRLESMADHWIRVGEWRAYGPQRCWQMKPVLTFLEPVPLFTNVSS
ncbi:actin-like protein arp8 [Coelomomyces lativittatus]|nr:actin-like protein arp8 [Coelomomyces lativittatus]